MLSLFDFMDKLTEEFSNHTVAMKKADGVYTIQVSTVVNHQEHGVQWAISAKELELAREKENFAEYKLKEIIREIHLSVVSEIHDDGSTARLHS